jgi:tRNA threonylcarbamoyladenosine biosynthesis protein TsaB
VRLGWDTSTDTVTVAVHDGAEVRSHRTGSAPRRHAEVLTPLVAEALAAADVEGPALAGIVVGVGPGAYTGLRVGLVTAQALGWAWHVPVHGACSLDALAVQAVADHPSRTADGLVVVADARRRQVFWARYDGSARRVAGPHVAAPDEVDTLGLPVVGSGAREHPTLFPEGREPVTPDAGWLLRGVAAGAVTLGPAEPVYLRRPDVTVAAGVKPVLQQGRPR